MNVSISVWEFFIPNFNLCYRPRCVDSYCVLFVLLFPSELRLKHLSLKTIRKFQLYSRQETIVALCLVNDFSDFDIFAFGDSLEFSELSIIWIYVRPLYWRWRIRQEMDNLVRTTLFHPEFHQSRQIHVLVPIIVNLEGTSQNFELGLPVDLGFLREYLA